MSDIHSYSNGKIVIKKSPIHGIGVFTTQDIRSGEFIEECPFLICSNRGNAVSARLGSYLYASEVIEDGKKIDGYVLLLGYGSLYNHSDQNNVEYTKNIEKGTFTYFAKRDIAADSELTILYKNNAFATT